MFRDKDLLPVSGGEAGVNLLLVEIYLGVLSGVRVEEGLPSL